MHKLLVLLLAGAFAPAAFAQSSDVESSLEPGAAAIGTDSSDADVNDRNCLRSTGSLITASANAQAERKGRKGDRCANAIGRSYDRDDIERTGATDVAQALRMLDPSIH